MQPTLKTSEPEFLQDFSELHCAIKSVIEKALPMLDSVEFYDPTRLEKGQQYSIDTPAVLIEMAEAQPGRYISGGRLAWDCSFYLHCILSAKTKCLPLAVRNLGAIVAQVVMRQHWGLAERGVEVVKSDSINLFPGMFKFDKGKNEASGFDSMIVAFEQTIHLGDMFNAPMDYKPDSITIDGSVTIGKDVWT